jgi:NAD(P)-dependent dehydrogenase (short-subunit alcohol dehydrogenase family)
MQGHQYGRSKALLLYFARELASRVSASQYHHVTINSVDPGAAWTPLTSPNQSRLIPRLIMNLSARDVKTGAKVLVNGVSSTEQTHGRVLLDYDISP